MNRLRGSRQAFRPFLADAPPPWSSTVRYGIAAMTVFIAGAIRYLLHPYLGYDGQYVVFFPAIVIIALFSGVPAALLATAASVLFVRSFLMPEVGTTQPPYLHDIVATAAFAISALFVAALAKTARRIHERLMAEAEESCRRGEQLKAESEQRLRVEKALRENEVRLREIADQSPSIIFLKDIQGRYLLSNKAFEGITHIPAAEIVGKTDADIFPAVQAASFRANDLKVLSAGVPLEFEETAIHDDGPHTSIVHKFPLRDSTGNVYGVGGIVTDITRRKEAEEALRIAEQGYADLVRSIDGIVWEAEPVNYKFSFVSQKAERLLLYPIERWLTETDFWKNHLHPDDRERIVRLCIEAARQKKSHDLEYRLIAADGRTVWVRDIVNVVIEHGETVKLRGVMIDITAEREVQDALRRSEEMLRITTEAAGVGLWTWDVINDRLEWNPVESEDINPQSHTVRDFNTFLSRLHPDDRAHVAKEIERCVREGCDLDIEYRIVRRDGSIRWRRSKGKTKFAEGHAIRVSGLSIDISRQKTAEQELKAARDRLTLHAEELEQAVKQRTEQLRSSLKDIEGFCYTIAHNLRAPIRAMRGLSQALVEDYSEQLDEAGYMYCSRINAAADRMDQLISDLLVYGRLSHLELPTEPVDLVAEIQRVLQHSQHQLSETHALVDVDTPMPKVAADVQVLDQVLENLINNALKFVPPDRRPHVHIYAESHDRQIRVWVEDNGIGIEPQYRDKIFGPFERLHTNEDYPGTGIGLAIVKRGVEKMGGQVGVESAPGRGSRFWIQLPAANR